MATAETTLTIQRNGATQNAADNKLEAANIRFVTYLVPTVRADGGEYDFYQRDAVTGAVLQTQGGKDRINANKLNDAVTKLMRQYHRGVVTAQIAIEEAAANAAALQAKIDADN